MPVEDTWNPSPPERTVQITPAGMIGTAFPRTVALSGSKGAAHNAPSRPNSKWPVDDHCGVPACSMITALCDPSTETDSIRSVPASVVTLEKRTVRPPGKIMGSLCSTSWRPASSATNCLAVPPCSGTIQSVPSRLYMISCEPQATLPVMSAPEALHGVRLP